MVEWNVDKGVYMPLFHKERREMEERRNNERK